MVNRGEEKVRVHMNVGPRSTMNTNDETAIIELHCQNLNFIRSLTNDDDIRECDTRAA